MVVGEGGRSTGVLLYYIQINDADVVGCTLQWGSGTWYPLDVAPGDETKHIIAQACKMAGKTSNPMQIMCYEKK